MSVGPDDAAHALLEDSIASRTLTSRPAPELERGARVAVHGAGHVGRQVVRLLTERGITVDRVMDARATTLQSLDGIPVVAPGSALDPSVPVVIAVFNRDADPRALHAAARASGARRIIDFVELHARFSRELGDRYWLVGQEELRAHADAMRAGLARWADAASREHYAALLAYRLTADPARLPDPQVGVPYRPADLPSPAGAARLIDGGAFDGDTIRGWFDAHVPVSFYWGVEPDPDNFAVLERWWHSREVPVVAHELVRAALGDRTDTVRFEAGGGEASALGERGGIDVALCTLDAIIGDRVPTELKLDIEGAEPAALEGARALITRAHPRLAICAYHRCEHLWSIAAWIGSLGAGYALHLRPHAHAGFDTVAYAL